MGLYYSREVTDEQHQKQCDRQSDSYGKGFYGAISFALILNKKKHA